MLRHADGTLTRLECSFYVDAVTTVGEGIEFHGDEGSLFLKSWIAPRCALWRHPRGGQREDVDLIDPEGDTTPADRLKDVDFALGLVDLARAIAEGRPHRCSGELGAHVVDAVLAVQRAARDGVRVPVSSTFPPPAPIGWELS